ncbi:hypothetical protein F0562_033758 [Nyssa sinensis]|uniref:Pentatricopeptide repeat-containing protein n=1 Tax=Nyssa sinensis TaxID=561372 RepID=A0A5J5AEL6_9ASTE|nr:hypothetical protein F0562_033758 [Nyssa sinensis]
MGGYLHVSQPTVVIDLFQQLQRASLKIGVATILSALSSVGDLGNVLGGESLHGYCIKIGFCLDLNVVNVHTDYIEEQQLVLDAALGTALVDMYAKCGLLQKAIDVFDRMESKDVKSWTAMISGFGIHGQAKNAVELFHRMEEEGFRPNEVTFLTVLRCL